MSTQLTSVELHDEPSDNCLIVERYKIQRELSNSSKEELHRDASNSVYENLRTDSISSSDEDTPPNSGSGTQNSFTIAPRTETDCFHRKSDSGTKDPLEETCFSENSIRRYKSFGALQNSNFNNHFCSKLYHTKRQVLNLKDYHDEARAIKDIQKFLDHPVVLFKVHHTLWEAVVEEMLQKLNSQKPELKLDIKSTKKSIISRDGVYVIPECLQGISKTPHGLETMQGFIVVIGSTNTVAENQVVMCLLDHPFNFGVGAEEIRLICIVLCPVKTKHTKSAVQVARTYATLLADDRLRHSLLNTHSPEEFAHEFEVECKRIQEVQEERERCSLSEEKTDNVDQDQKSKWYPGKDIITDVKQRSKFYASDFIKDINDCISIQKIISTTLFLYFSLLLPAIAFGVLDAKFTEGKLDAKNVIVSQALAGTLWVIFGGQHLVIIRTTIPLVIYTKVIYTISKSWAEDGSFFYTFYAMVGLVNSFFLVLYGLTGASRVMVFCSRSTEEILGLFISVAFIFDSGMYIKGEFDQYYCTSVEHVSEECNPTKPILALLLIFITVFIGVQIYNFKYSPYLTAGKRGFVADYALVVAVAVGTFIGAYLFNDVNLEKFTVNEERPLFQIVQFKTPSVSAIFTSIGVGFIMSILFFMENNIAASIVNNPSNKLQKGFSYHYDMMVSGFINAILSVFGLPLVHGSLPHSPLHVRALADIEEHVENGHLSENVVYVRETRLTTLIAHIMIAASVLLVPYPLNMIPIPVLYGLFVFLSVTALRDFQLWERLVLIFTEQSLYPPFHYVRKVPQKIIHCFTLLQLLQLCILCVVSFAGSAYLKMFFPFVIFLLMPVRMKLLPKIISDRHLIALDGDC